MGTTWQVDEPSVTVAGAWQDVYRAIDEHRHVLDVSVSAHRAADAAETFVRRTMTTGVRPQSVTTDRAAALPEVAHQTGKVIQHLTQRRRSMRGVQTGGKAQTVCAGHGFISLTPRKTLTRTRRVVPT